MKQWKEAAMRGEQQRDMLRGLPLPKDVESALARLASWSHEYGSGLCSGGKPDTFGEGMRAAKEQVAAILSGMRGETEDAPSSVLWRIESAICIEGDYVPDGADDARHPVERRIAAMNAVILRMQDATDATRPRVGVAEDSARKSGLQRVLDGLFIFFRHGGADVCAQHDRLSAGPGAGATLTQEEQTQLKADGWFQDEDAWVIFT